MPDREIGIGIGSFAAGALVKWGISQAIEDRPKHADVLDKIKIEPHPPAGREVELALRPVYMGHTEFERVVEGRVERRRTAEYWLYLADTKEVIEGVTVRGTNVLVAGLSVELPLPDYRYYSIRIAKYIVPSMDVTVAGETFTIPETPDQLLREAEPKAGTLLISIGA